MDNSVYYVKPSDNNHPQAIFDGFVRSIISATEKGITNIKLIVSNWDILDGDYIVDGFKLLFPHTGEQLAEDLRRNRAIRLENIPEEGKSIGVTAFSANGNLSFPDDNTVALVIYSDSTSLIKAQSLLWPKSIDLVAVLYYPTDQLNELMSAMTAIKYPEEPLDLTVTAYTNTFSKNVADIMNKLLAISKNESATHLLNRRRMDVVVEELTGGHHKVSYLQFLGFLINDVKYRLDYSISLLHRHRRYFGR